MAEDVETKPIGKLLIPSSGSIPPTTVSSPTPYLPPEESPPTSPKASPPPSSYLQALRSGLAVPHLRNAVLPAQAQPQPATYLTKAKFVSPQPQPTPPATYLPTSDTVIAHTGASGIYFALGASVDHINPAAP